MSQQTRLGSLLEAITNVFIGFWVGYFSQLVIFPLVGVTGVSHTQNFTITCFFTVVSLVRSYAVRRLFNMGLRRLLNKLAQLITKE